MIAAGGIPVVLDLREFAQLLAAVSNDTPREQQTEKQIEEYRGAMDVALRAMRTRWQAHPDALRIRIAELLEAVDDLLSGPGPLDRDELERRARAIRDLADWADAGPEHFQLVDGERFPVRPRRRRGSPQRRPAAGAPGHPLAVVADGLRVVPSPEADYHGAQRIARWPRIGELVRLRNREPSRTRQAMTPWRRSPCSTSS